MYDLVKLNQLVDPLSKIHVKYYREIHSTNTEALALIENDAIEDNTLLLAEEQTAGRGRLQRTWVSAPEDSLTFSLVLRDSSHFPETPSILTLVAGLAVHDAVQEFTTAEVFIKWPNDILLNGKKVCGILTESVWQPPILSGVVVGIGINIGEKAVPPQGQMRYPAASIQSITGQRVEREAILAHILQSFYQWLPLADSQALRSEYENHLAFMGESVNIINEVDQTNVTGKCLGITPTGALILQTSNGQTYHAEAGEVSLRPES